MKKQHQLGMNPSTASHRLVKDILFRMICESGKNSCHHCGEQMSREDFTIEHKKPWLDSEDPVGLYFDQDNISFSHHKCNVSAARRVKAPCGTSSSYNRGCRCKDCTTAKNTFNKSYRTSEKRHAEYERRKARTQ